MTKAIVNGFDPPTCRSKRIIRTSIYRKRLTDGIRQSIFPREDVPSKRDGGNTPDPADLDGQRLKIDL